MEIRVVITRAVVTYTLLLGALCFPMGGVSAEEGQLRQQSEPPSTADVEPLTRGPIHEAFAAPVVYDPVPGAVVPREPPANIAEMPPDQKPPGADVTWIPGYWSWDAEREDFIWVSGLWRAVPPGREFVPGYWQKVETGWRWVSGYWKRSEQRETTYLPPPPKSLEVGPSAEPTAEASLWVPGCWAWHDSTYFWRPGYWVSAEPEWVWTPAHYVWTPGGCVFVDGFWDFVPIHRGLVFAPVVFHRRVFADRHFSFTPVITIDTHLAFNHLFVVPASGHFFFGDFFAPRFVAIGFVPVYRFRRSRIGCDPVFEHRLVLARRSDPGFEARVRERFEFLVKHPEARPPQTFAAQRGIRTGSVEARPLLGRPLAKVTSETKVKLESVDETHRERLRSASANIRNLTTTRHEAEMKLSRERERTEIHQRPLFAPTPRSPIAARPRSTIRAPSTPRPSRPRVQLRPESRRGHNQQRRTHDRR